MPAHLAKPRPLLIPCCSRMIAPTRRTISSQPCEETTLRKADAKSANRSFEALRPPFTRGLARRSGVNAFGYHPPATPSLDGGVGSDRVNITAKVIRQKPAGANFEATAHFRSQPQKRPASVTGQAQSLAALCRSEHSRNSVNRAMVVTLRCVPPRLTRSLTTRATKVGRSLCRHSSRSSLCGKAPDRLRQRRTIQIKSDRSFCGARNRAAGRRACGSMVDGRIP
jgi:hypothetical protein